MKFEKENDISVNVYGVEEFGKYFLLNLFSKKKYYSKGAILKLMTIFIGSKRKRGNNQEVEQEENAGRRRGISSLILV